MSEINLGATIARKRKAQGITQEELAEHLGVTKAAVSKWELGQSLPDVAQLPRIAAYFSISLDELLSYEPQLSDDELRSISLKIAHLLHDDLAMACEECRRYARDYYSCYPLLLSLGSMLLNGAVRADSVAPDQGIVSEATALFERVAEHAEDIALIRRAKWCLASVSLATGQVNDAIETLEAIKPGDSLEIETMLASAYQAIGETDKAIRIQQEHLFWGVMATVNGCTALIGLAGDDTERIDALVKATEGVIEAFDLKKVSPMYEFSLQYQASVAYKKAGDLERAYLHLDRFADAARIPGILTGGGNPGMLFDHAADLFGVGAREDESESFALMMSGLMEAGLDQMLFAAPEWADSLDDPRFEAVVAKLAALGVSPKNSSSSRDDISPKS